VRAEHVLLHPLEGRAKEVYGNDHKQGLQCAEDGNMDYLYLVDIA
jgi:hypothetical protein